MKSFYGAAGQRCLANSLVLTVDAAHDVARDRVAEAARGLFGDGLEPGVDMGPVVSAAARDRIVAAIEAGLSDSTEAVLDGRGATVPERPRGYFVGPPLLDHVSPDTRLYREELFGPVVGMTRVGSLDEAIALINDDEYGNAASIFTESGAVARKFRYGANVGNIGINVGVATPMAYFPFSAARGSFFGALRPQGRAVIRFYTESKVVITRWGAGDASAVIGVGR